MDSKQPVSVWAANSPSTNHTCPMCEQTGVTTSVLEDAFVYGSGESAAELRVNIPVRHCPVCDFQFTDHEADEIRHRAVCEHLGALPPEAIVRIRKKHGLSRAAFAQITGLGEASLSRWEKGINIQNPGNDRYIRLLEDTRVMQELRNLARREELGSGRQEDNVLQFRILRVTEDLRQQQAEFQLRTAV